MINLIEGGFFAGGRDLIKATIAERCESKKKSFLIVPEQDTVASEDEMAEYLSGSAPLFAEVTNFTRFSDIVFRALGGSSSKSVDSVKRALIMWKTLTELSPLLEASSRKGDVTHGSVSKAIATVKQMQSFAISPSELAATETEIAKRSEDARLRAKVSDISKILSLYTSLLSEHTDSVDDSLLLATEKLETSDASFLRNTEFFIDGFTSFTVPQYRMIATLAKHCSVTISLIIPKSSPNAYEYSETSDTDKKLISLASKAGIDVTRKRIDGRHGVSSLLLSEVTDLLWKSNAKVDSDALNEGENLRIFEAENPYEECDFIASDIRRRVMSGENYSDFGIIARNIESYEGILDVSFKKAGVPLFFARKNDIASYEAIKLIYSALATVLGGFKRSDVIAYSKCSLCGLSRELADELELYAEKWQINGKRFTDGIVWNMNPSGYTEKRRAGDEEKLLRIDGARATVISALSSLGEGIKNSTTVKEYSAALVDFLTLLDIENKLKAKHEEEKRLYGINSEIGRIWKTICVSLDSLCEVLGDTKVTPDTFFCLLKITFSETDIGKIPAFTQEVTAASANIARMRGKRHIYILGANAGIFPATSEEDSYFTDKDKKILSSLGLPLDSDSDIKSAGELYYFTRSLTFAKESVTITYSSADASFKAISVSDAIIRIKSLTGGAISPKKLSSLAGAEKTFSAEYAFEHLSKSNDDFSQIKGALSRIGYDEKLKVSDGAVKNAALKLSLESIDTLYGKSIPMTQSKLELFAKCPMNYFCTYNLGLKDNEKAEFDARNIGNFLHAVLENFFRELKKRGKTISFITEEEKINLISEVADNYISKCFEGIPKTSARLQDTIKKLSAYTKPIIDNLCDEFSNCKYEPIFFELEIDKRSEDKPNPIVFNTESGKSIYITGKIDRVDAYANDENIYVRVVDYKSGKKVFSPSDIENGMNLQMFLYLKAIVDTDKEQFIKEFDSDTTKKIIPAGVLYVKTGVDDIKAQHETNEDILLASKDSRQRLGMVLDDSESLSAMNPNYIPVRFKNNGEPDSYTKKYLYTENGWSAIGDSIEKAVTDICNKMISGNIDALPLAKSRGKSDVCQYCKFKSVCRNAN